MSWANFNMNFNHEYNVIDYVYWLNVIDYRSSHSELHEVIESIPLLTVFVISKAFGESRPSCFKGLCLDQFIFTECNISEWVSWITHLTSCLPENGAPVKVPDIGALEQIAEAFAVGWVSPLGIFLESHHPFVVPTVPSVRPSPCGRGAVETGNGIELDEAYGMEDVHERVIIDLQDVLRVLTVGWHPLHDGEMLTSHVAIMFHVISLHDVHEKNYKKVMYNINASDWQRSNISKNVSSKQML